MSLPPSKWAYLDHPGPLPIAHRGGAGENPENTMSSFAHAVSLGYRYLETDVHATSDGALVAFHDNSLDRVTDRTGRIRDLRWADVKQARIGNEPIPLLAELLEAFPDARFNVDMKEDSALRPFIELLDATKAHERVCAAAFSDRRLARFRAVIGNRVCTALGPAAIARLRFASWGTPTGNLPGACAQVPVRRGPIPIVDSRFVTEAHRRDVRVHVWTIDDAAEMERLLDLGVDGIMSDRPAVLKEVLERRSQWA
jgi:glycerophosphoryl diester phosphodiesterase